jgi:hypothetical protein
MKKFIIYLLSIILVFSAFIPSAAAWHLRHEKEDNIVSVEVETPSNVQLMPKPIRQEMNWTNYYSAKRVSIGTADLVVEDVGGFIEAPQPETNIVDNKVYTSNLESEATVLAKIMYKEGRGLASVTEQACIAWVILNRVDAGWGTVYQVASAPNQFAWDPNARTVDDYGRDLVKLAEDILGRWQAEKNGQENIGRVLPNTYLYFGGRDGHNWFRENYKSNGIFWNYSLASPYES